MNTKGNVSKTRVFKQLTRRESKKNVHSDTGSFSSNKFTDYGTFNSMSHSSTSGWRADKQLENCYLVVWGYRTMVNVGHRASAERSSGSKRWRRRCWITATDRSGAPSDGYTVECSLLGSAEARPKMQICAPPRSVESHYRKHSTLPTEFTGIQFISDEHFTVPTATRCQNKGQTRICSIYHTRTSSQISLDTNELPQL